MIENARRQLILVVATLVAALLCTVLIKPSLGLDLSGGTQLIYELDIEKAKAAQLVDPAADPQTIMRETLPIIADRIDPTGTKDIPITQRGDNQFLVELPKVTNEEAELLMAQIETLGRLEMRVLADAEYDNAGVKFDMAKETQNLRAWLDKDGNRDKVAKSPEALRLFNVLPADQGGPDSRHLLWYPGKITRSYRDSERWDYSHATDPSSHVVAVYQPEQYAAAPPPKGDPKNEPFLIEAFPINMHEVHFQGENMNAAAVRAGHDTDSGQPCVFYEMGAGHKTAYADWSQQYTGKRSAIILNGVVRSAPQFRGRIYGIGLITGGFTDPEANDLAKVIKTGSLQVKPERISRKSIGANLGERSVRLGFMSIAVGGLVVLVFILAYYRLSGLVAFLAILINALLIVGVMQLIKATWTLPGIAGIVLTMGMAVDGNILIYERIREELKRGKQLLQAVRAGFDRAAVTIIDANLTTLAVGLVLYNLGVGPIRGFAVTLMIGIVTTLFTTIMVSRLIFHYLLLGRMKEFRAAQWLANANYDFLKWTRVCVVGSVLTIALGLGYIFTLSGDRWLGLDFTGGAALEVALQEPTSADDIRARLAADETMNKEFPSPLVNTSGEVTGGQARFFDVKLKLSGEQRERFARERREAEARKEAYEPPYKAGLRRVLGSVLVAEPLSDIAVGTRGDKPNIKFGNAVVHFSQPVAVPDVDAQLKRLYGSDAEALPAQGDAQSTRDVYVSFPLGPDGDTVKVSQGVTEALRDLKDSTGNPVVLSNPIPNAEEIGGRMVGGLRTAAIGALIMAMLLIIMYVRVRFHEYKYGIAGVVALVHDVAVAFVVTVIANRLGLVNAEVDLGIIAALLTIVGYSINDTIVIFDRVRENLSNQKRLGDTKETFPQLINRSLNETLSRTILTSAITLFVVISQFVVNKGSGSTLEGFAFCLMVGMVSGVYSTVYIASPIVVWLRQREAANHRESEGVAAPTSSQVAPEGV